MNWVAWKMLTGDRAKYLGTVFGVAFGVLLTLFFPKFGREDLTARNLLRKGVAAVLVTAGVMLADGQ